MKTKTCKFKKGLLVQIDEMPINLKAYYFEVEKRMKERGYSLVKKTDWDPETGYYQKMIYAKAETKEDELEIALMTHTWGFADAEPLASWRAGMSEVEHIRSLVRSIGTRGYDMVVKYIDDHFHSGGHFTADFYR